MKRSKIKGYINDLENKNFSFDKSIKILDISNAVYIDIIANGNGTASRESEAFIADVIKDSKR